MKRFKVFIIAMLSCAMFTYAQTDIWINGFIFSEENGKQKVIPFASIYIYEKGTDDLVYYTLSGIAGNYAVKPYDYKKQYHVVVDAGGYNRKEFNIKEIPKSLNGKPFSGNRTCNIKMEKDSTDSNFIQVKKYVVKELMSKNGIHKFDQLVSCIDGINREGSNWLTKDGGSVALFLNGNVLQTKQLTAIEQLPLNSIDMIEVYSLLGNDNYENAINIVLNIGKKATLPSYKMKECELIF